MQWTLDEPELSKRKSEFFSLINVWPSVTELDPSGWMSNFTPEEQTLAGHLLSGFTYINKEMCSALFISAFHQLSMDPHLRGSSPSRHSNWEWFRNNVVITHVEGETPSTTDSGHIFARMARTALGIPESNIVTPERALRILSSGSRRPIVFVDDFLGSGSQFVSTWKRMYSLSFAHESSFAIEFPHQQTDVYFIPLIATKAGMERIHSLTSDVRVCATHVLDEKDSALTHQSQIWPEHLRDSGIGLIRSASQRAGISDKEWQGYENLGLCLSFEHSTPDATLPIFHHEKNWHPLIRRS